MPRLLPRLLKALQQPPFTHSTSVRVARTPDGRIRKKKSLYRPPPVSLPTFSPAGRTRSILLDENPVTDKQVFARRKRLPPRVHLGPRPVELEEYDVPREMTIQEREWWSSPYLRMLATPPRQCTISKRHLPKDFLLKFAVLRLPATQSAGPMEVLMPDGLEHPKYKRGKARVAVYVSCWKNAIETMKSPVSLPYYGASIHFSNHLCAHISYLLRLRVIQELEVLIDALKRYRGQIEFDADADPTILRRLTRAEFKALRETGVIPFADAVAVIIVPPVNRDPITKLRPQPSREPEIPSSPSNTPPNTVHEKTLPPLSSLHEVRVSAGVSEQGTDCLPEKMPSSTMLPNARIPLYNGVTMYPRASHRAAVHALLRKLLNIERHFRGTPRTSETRATAGGAATRSKGDARASHAFLLLSSAETVKRADTAALAIALWRLRMWEGDAFAGTVEGWEIGKEWRMKQCSRL